MRRFAFLAALLVACAHSNGGGVVVHPYNEPFVDELPPPNPIVPATEEDARACAHLAALGCSDAKWCMQAITDARTDHMVVPSTCVAAAVDVAAVRRCGDKSTLTFECKGEH